MNKAIIFGLLLLPCALQSVAAHATPTCPEGIGASAGDAPKKVFHLGDSPALLLCGFSDTEKGFGRYYSEFDLVNTESGEDILTFYALDTTKVKQVGNKVYIVLYKNYPINADLDYKELPFKRYTVQWGNNQFDVGCALVLDKPTFSQAELNRIYQEYLQAKKKGKAVEGLGEVMVIAAMSGSERFRRLLPEVPRALHLDGAWLEDFDAGLGDMKELESGRCEDAPFYPHHTVLSQ